MTCAEAMHSGRWATATLQSSITSVLLVIVSSHDGISSDYFASIGEALPPQIALIKLSVSVHVVGQVKNLQGRLRRVRGVVWCSTAVGSAKLHTGRKKAAITRVIVFQNPSRCRLHCRVKAERVRTHQVYNLIFSSQEKGAHAFSLRRISV